MFDFAFATASVRSEVRRIDFFNYPGNKKPGALDIEVARALAFASDPAAHIAEISYSILKGKHVARTTTFRTALALRKLDRNLKQDVPRKSDTRTAIVLALKGMLEEGVPFNFYKLDIRSFYESFEHVEVSECLQRMPRATTACQRIVSELIKHHALVAPKGIPRGLPLSATLSDALMQAFDAYVESHEDVFFYRRYVDDLVLLTSKREIPKKFLASLSSKLPSGLIFNTNPKKKFEFPAVRFKSEQAKHGKTPVFWGFDYLGYRFEVAQSDHRPTQTGCKEVTLDIANGKVGKIKTKLIRCFISFLQSKDFALLESRIKHLTTNMSLLDRARGIRRTIGLRYNYPLVDVDRSAAIIELDRFLTNALVSRKGRVFGKLAKTLTDTQRQSLAKLSFTAGARGNIFYQLNLVELGKVQKCWKYA